MNHVPEYAAVRHILGAPSIAARTAPYIQGGEVDFDGLLHEAETMSGGESVLVEIAFELWTAERVTGVRALVRSLDPHNFERVVEAMRIARDPFAPELEDEKLAA